MILLKPSLISKLNLAKVNSSIFSIKCQQITSTSVNKNKDVLNKDFWDKNEKLKRPISPYIMYKLQLTSVLSISHRLTGLGLGVPLYTMGIAQLVTNNHWANQLNTVQQICPEVFTFVKYLAIASFAYHTFNGVRHLFWDLAIGFELKQLYFTGYLVILVSLLATAIAIYKY